MVCVNAMMMDTIEYGEWKTGQRNEAMITSTRCFVTKCVKMCIRDSIWRIGYAENSFVEMMRVLLDDPGYTTPALVLSLIHISAVRITSFVTL